MPHSAALERALAEESPVAPHAATLGPVAPPLAVVADSELGWGWMLLEAAF